MSARSLGAEGAERWLSGGCSCGAVRFRVADDFAYALNCHCSRCRLQTGSAFKPFGGIARERLELLAGAAQLQRVGDEVGHDARCGRCGSLLYSLVREGAYVHVPYGALADTPTRRPGAHIFVGSKAPWYDILDDLQRFEGLPPR